MMEETTTREGAAREALSEEGRTYAPHEAVIEASRCLMCEDPPCNVGCPAGVDVRRFIRKIRFGNFRGAARLVRDANLMVGICGRICPQEMLCMERCTRAALDTPIDIAGLQRFAGDVELGETAPLPEIGRREGRVAVIGAGPAGLAAAAELRKAGLEVVIFERSEEPGGVLTRGIPPFRLDPAFTEGELAYVERLGADLRLGEEVEDPVSLLDGGFDAVFVSAGLWRSHAVGLEGETLDGVMLAGDLLTRVASGDRPDLGERVVVIGGGNVAMDAAATALRLGAERVYVCCLESREEMPAFPSEVESAQSEGIEFRTRTRPVRILGKDGEVVGYEGAGIRWKQPGLLVPSNAEDVPGTEFRIAADSVVEAIGQGVLTEFTSLDLSDRGLVRVDPETMETSVEGVFAGGDIVSGGGTAVQAVADGKGAAESIVAYVEGIHESSGSNIDEGAPGNELSVFEGRDAEDNSEERRGGGRK
ncbi:MAG: NAD(P)-binding protein [Candidatus Eisenbacteria bacterium]|nr:NAD(P)-binding protein [Candidatus Eisenbacteria bacterium]